jgi:hypothetical protein
MDDQRTDREGGGMKQFSIRDLLFVILIVALALGWWLDRRPVAARFQMEATNTIAYVVDTATGQVWSQNTNGFRDPKPLEK